MKKQVLGERILQMIVVLFGISFLTFFLTYLAPGDPAEAMFAAAEMVPAEEQLQAVRESMGLDKPFIVQYTTWLTNCLRGDFGVSYTKNTAVITLLAQRLWPTLKLALVSLGMMLVFSIPLGIVSAVYQNKWVDYVIRFMNFFGITMPGFWVGLMLQYVFALKLHLLPVVSAGNDFKKILLPAITLAIAMTSKYTRQVRIAVIEELNQDYVVGAKARGAGKLTILFRHVLPNAMLPLVTMLGLSFGSLMGGTTIVELIFTYPGLGQLAVSAVTARDYPLIQGFVLWVALIYMIVNLLVDVSYGLLDPRIREKR